MQFGDWVVLDWSNVPGLFDWIGLALAVAGFWIAIRQLRKSRSALVAAENALESARRSLSSNQLLSVLPAFEELSNQLNTAVREDVATSAETALDRFRLRHSEAVALLRILPKEYQSLLPSLNRAENSARTAYTNLFAPTTDTTAQRVGNAAADLRDLVYEIRSVEVSLRHAVPSISPGSANA